ncbi:hypothetical protein B0J12DRAFT_219133 [Macrophomina phaseolina]|uniref:Uncharacterized protein n=1 Tax=Macrophomina phaseolina TaxID=35725 RepID=A0ABQ8G170_9PEZI|nr:hypothetical protein B0J12DRAFT_219133 [Macrophomina phaseolina]
MPFLAARWCLVSTSSRTPQSFPCQQVGRLGLVGRGGPIAWRMTRPGPGIREPVLSEPAALGVHFTGAWREQESGASIHHISRLRHERAAAACRAHRLTARRLGYACPIQTRKYLPTHHGEGKNHLPPWRQRQHSVSFGRPDRTRQLAMQVNSSILGAALASNYIVRRVGARVIEAAGAFFQRLSNSASDDGRAGARRRQGWYGPILSIDR